MNTDNSNEVYSEIEEFSTASNGKEANFETHANEDKSENLRFVEQTFFTDFDQGPKEPQVFKDKLMVPKEKIVKDLSRFDSTEILIGELY